MQIKVLVVGDHGVVREALACLLKGHAGIHVVGQEADGRDAVREAKRLAPDVVVMDLSPGMDGIAAAESICAAQSAQVVIVSMHDAPDVVVRALQAGARGFVSRKSGAGDLVKAVQAAAYGKRYLGAGIAEDLVETLPAPRATPGALGNLTDTERRILQHTVDGKSNAEMAEILSLSHRTVETYRLIMMRKLGLRGLPALVKFAIRHGITSVD